ncbi:hypothetical protein H0H81_009474 [Sphagnurus paluster]|uniref:Uncharacterized protein n=1 Tax=Sphagnurus paluster TaxID=117069 RepID=A0A9P7GQK6_9AGAR|nr:hypothetical protein H0H81_009474 [Sphagnurus paluster]
MDLNLLGLASIPAQASALGRKSVSVSANSALRPQLGGPWKALLELGLGTGPVCPRPPLPLPPRLPPPMLASVVSRVRRELRRQKSRHQQTQVPPDLRRWSDFMHPFPEVQPGGYRRYYEAHGMPVPAPMPADPKFAVPGKTAPAPVPAGHSVARSSKRVYEEDSDGSGVYQYQYQYHSSSSSPSTSLSRSPTSVSSASASSSSPPKTYLLWAAPPTHTHTPTPTHTPTSTHPPQRRDAAKRTQSQSRAQSKSRSQSHSYSPGPRPLSTIIEVQSRASSPHPHPHPYTPSPASAPQVRRRRKRALLRTPSVELAFPGRAHTFLSASSPSSSSSSSSCTNLTSPSMLFESELGLGLGASGGAGGYQSSYFVDTPATTVEGLGEEEAAWVREQERRECMDGEDGECGHSPDVRPGEDSESGAVYGADHDAHGHRADVYVTSTSPVEEYAYPWDSERAMEDGYPGKLWMPMPLESLREVDEGEEHEQEHEISPCSVGDSAYYSDRYAYAQEYEYECERPESPSSFRTARSDFSHDTDEE